MIVQCPACRELAQVERAVLDEGGRRAGLTCSACGGVSWLPTDRADASDAAPVGAAAGGGSPATASSAPSASAADPALEEAALGLPATGAAEELVVEGLRQLLLRWDDPAAHRALIQRASEAGALPALGVRYRRVLEMRPGDEAAKRAQQEILNLALAAFSSRPDASDRDDMQKRARAVLSLAAVGLLLLGVCAFLFFTLQGL